MDIRLITIPACIAALLIICSCSESYKERRQIKTNASELKEYVRYINNTEQQIIGSLDLSEIDNQGMAFTYLINAECSSCIADFIRFLTSLRKSNIDIRCYGICNDTNKEILMYYMNEIYEEQQTSEHYPTLIFLDEPYPFFKQHSRRNVLILNNNNIIGHLLFSNNRVIFTQ